MDCRFLALPEKSTRPMGAGTKRRLCNLSEAWLALKCPSTRWNGPGKQGFLGPNCVTWVEPSPNSPWQIRTNSVRICPFRVWNLELGRIHLLVLWEGI